MDRTKMTRYGPLFYDRSDSRMFGNKRYFHWGTHAGKRDAQDRAKYLRNRGYLVRIVKSGDYRVYIRKKGR